MISTEFSGNKAVNGSGGAFGIWHGVNLSIEYSKFSMNFAKVDGGAINVQVGYSVTTSCR